MAGSSRSAFPVPITARQTPGSFPGRMERFGGLRSPSTGDEHQIDRWEYYDASLAGPDGRGALIRAAQDTTHDGKPDRWETYENGVLEIVAFDENGNGSPDCRLTYAASRLLDHRVGPRCVWPIHEAGGVKVTVVSSDFCERRRSVQPARRRQRRGQPRLHRTRLIPKE